MPFDLSILAQADEGIGKLIFPILFFIIWILSAIAGALGKRQKEKERRRRLEEASMRERAEIERRQREAQAPVPPPIRQRPPERRPPPRRTVPRDNRGFDLPQVPPAPPPPPVPARPEAAPAAAPRPARVAREARTARVARPEAAEMSGVPSTTRSRAASSAAGPIRNLMTPRTLQQQIIMMEILGKPVALRDGD